MVKDKEWYLANQIHPPIGRLCEPIDGTDSARIADCLGKFVSNNEKALMLKSFILLLLLLLKSFTLLRHRFQMRSVLKMYENGLQHVLIAMSKMNLRQYSANR